MADRDYAVFANAPRDDEGNVLDPLEVDSFVDETDEGKVRDESQTTESSVVKFRSEGPSTNGAPAAQVPAPDSNSEAEVTSEEDAEDADAAEGQGANES